MLNAIIGALRVVLGAETAAFEDGLTHAQKTLAKTGRDLQKLGQKFTNVGTTLSVGLTAPLAALAVTSVRAAEESAQAFGQVEAALKSMGDASGRSMEQLEAQAKALQGLSTFDDDEILRKVTANLLTFGNVSEEVFDRAQVAIVDVATRMGTDLQSAAIMVGKALNDPAKGLAALRRVGIQFTEDQVKQIKTMAAVGNVAGAQAVMLAELERQFGGSAKAMQDATPGDALKDSWSEFTETIGAIAIEVLPPLTSALSKILNAFTALPEPVQTGIVVFAGLAAAVGPVLVGIGGLISVVGSLSAALPTIAPLLAGIAAGFSALLPILATVGRVLLGMLVSTGPIGWLILALGAVVVVWKNWDKIGPIVEKVYTAVKTWIMDRLGAVFTWLKDRLAAVGGWFFDLYDKVVGHSYIPDMVEGIAEWMAKLDAGMVEPARNATKKTKDAFQKLRDDVAQIMDGLLTDQEAASRDIAAQSKVLLEALNKGMISPGQAAQAAGRLEGTRPEVQSTVEAARVPGSVDIMPTSVAMGGIAESLERSRQAIEGPLQDMFGNAFYNGFRVAFEGGSLSDIAGSFMETLGVRAADNLSRILTDGLMQGLSGLFAGGAGGGGLGGLLGGLAGGMRGLFGFNRGTDFTVRGRAGVDQNLVAFRASRGERVKVETEAQQRANGVRGGAIFNITLPGLTDARDARRAGKVVAAELGNAWAMATRQGVG